MNKIFWGLVILSAVGAGILFWLMSTLPTPHVAPTAKEVVATRPTTDKPTDKLTNKLTDKPADKPTDKPATSSEDGVLTVRTDPVKALVFVGGELKGETPVKIPLAAQSQNVKITAEGFEDYTREMPALSGDSVGSNVTWKIQLHPKKSSKPETPLNPITTASTTSSPAKKVAASPAPAEPPKAPESKDEINVSKSATEDPFITGHQGPVFIQLKAMAVSEGADALTQAIDDYRASLKLSVSGCRVNLGEKGEWMRILVGPFKSKSEANSRLAELHKGGVQDAFVTGAQKCLL
jgi:hypothetical protein